VVARGAINVNEDPKDYRYRINSSSAHATDRNTPLSVSSYLRLGWGDIDQIEIKLYEHDNGTGTQVTGAYLTTPWGSYSSTGGSWNTSHDSTMEIDGLYLTVAADCTYEFGFDELRWYDEGVLKATIGAQVETGSGFDLRLDVVRLMALVNEDEVSAICDQTSDVDPATYTCATGPGYYSAETTWDDEVGNSVVGGYQWYNGSTWVNDPVSLESISNPTSGCGCITALPTISEAESYTVRVDAAYSDIKTKTDLGTSSCSCPSGGGQTWDFWKYNITNAYSTAWVDIIPNTSGILNHTVEAEVTCYEDSDTSSTTSEGAETFGQMKAEIWNLEVEKFCAHNVSSTPCIVGEECTGLPTYTSSGCCTYIRQEVSWPDLPKCVFEGPGVQYDVSHGLTHWRAYIEAATGKVYVGYTPNNLPAWSDRDSGLTADHIAMRLDRATNQILLLTETAGTITLYTSADGKSFSSVTTWSGYRPALLIGRDRKRHIAWFDGTSKVKSQIRDAANTVIKASFDAVSSVDDDQIALDEAHLADGSKLLVMLVVGSGSVKEYTSPDGVTWTLAATIASGSKPAIHIGQDGRRHLFWLDASTNFVGEIRNAANAAIKTGITVASSVDPEQPGVDESFLGDGKRRLVTLYLSGGSLTQKTSPDGVVWS
jgi:hypothetical protein